MLCVNALKTYREEEYYVREAVLGRDASSVFPKEATQQQDANREAMVEALGARKFISESEVGRRLVLERGRGARQVRAPCFWERG